MKLNLKVILLSAILGLGSAVESVAADLSNSDVGVFAYTCSEPTSAAPEVTCFIGQYASVDDATWDIFTTSEVYDSWNDLVTAIESDTRLTASSPATGVTFYLKTDLDFGGYKDDGSEVTCVNDFKPINFGALYMPLKEFNGRYDGVEHVIRNFCQIGTGTVGFLGNIDDCNIQNLHFDNAYVNAKSAYRGIAAAGVVAAVAKNVTFGNISVDRSKVFSYDAAGGLFGIDSVTTASATDPQFVASILQVDVELNAPMSGGLIGRLAHKSGLLSFRSNTVSATFTGSALGTKTGGLVGMVVFNGSTATDTMSVECEANNVTLTYEALPSNDEDLFVGGLFGDVSLLKTIKVLNGSVKTRISSAGYGDQYFGGLVGRVRMTQTKSDRDSVVVRNNQVDVSIASTSTKNFTLTMGGLIGFGGEFNDGTNDYERGAVYVSDNDVVTASMEAATSGTVYAGGLAGRIKAEVKNGTAPCGAFKSTSTTVKAPDGQALISTSSTGVQQLYAGGFIGLADFSAGEVEIRRAYVEGDIDIAAETVSSGVGVGGMIGKLDYYRANLYDNLSVGNIRSGSDNVGFVIGSCSSEYEFKDKIVMYANVHQGTDDVDAKDAMGSFALAGNAVTGWAAGDGSVSGYSYVFRYNYRNAVESGSAKLEPTGLLGLNGDGNILITNSTGAVVDSVQNGVLDDSTMVSRELTYILSKKSVDRYDPGLYDKLDSSSFPGKVSFICWESEKGKIPHVCESTTDTRTAYKVEISLAQIKSSLSADDIDALQKEGVLYKTPIFDGGGLPTGDSSLSLITYSEKDGSISADFLDKVKFLSAKYGFVDALQSVNLNYVNIAGDIKYGMDVDYMVKIEYQVYSDAQGSYVNMDDPSLGPVYSLLPKTQVSRYNSTDMVPTAALLSESFSTVYSVEEVTMECNGTVVNCPPTPIYIPGGYVSYTEVLDALKDYLGPTQENVVQLRYANRTPSLVPSVGNTSSQTEITVTYSGYKEGVHYDYRQVDVEKVSEAGSMIAYELPAAYSASVETGFDLHGWTVDFWAYAVGYDSDIQACYFAQMPPSICGTEITVNATDAYFTDVKSFVDTLSAAMNTTKLVKWTADIDSLDQVYMDSLAKAIGAVKAKGLSYDYVLMWTPKMDAITYYINFDVNEGDFPVFISGNTNNLTTYSRADTSTVKLPKLSSTKACFDGWKETASEPSVIVSEELNVNLLNNVTIQDGTFSLYGKWSTPETSAMCYDPDTTTITLEYAGGDSTLGEVYLWQALVNPSDSVIFRHDFKNNSIAIPDLRGNKEDRPFVFHVGSVPKQGYVLANVDVTYLNSGFTPSNFDILNDELVYIYPMDIVDGVLLTANFAQYVDIELVLNKGEEGLFYDMDYTLGDPLTVIDDAGRWFEVPTWIYTADACVLGWAFSENAPTYDFRTANSGSAIYQGASDKKLYAVWGEADSCVAQAMYVSVTAESDKGSLELIESDATGKSRVHTFDVKGNRIILPPMKFAGTFTVHGVGEKGYKLDKVELDELGYVTEFREGDTIAISVDGAKLTAYFIEDNSPAGGEPVLMQSGNAVQFNVSVYSFAKRDTSWYHISLEDDDGNSVEDTLFECFTKNCYVYWDKFPLKSGNYLFSAALFNGVDTTIFERTFEVKSEIAVGKSWHMVALASADMGSFGWDGDEKVYWWNESANYGSYWQYQELTKKGKPQVGVGYWYNSIEGRPLKVGDNAFADTMTWQLDSVNTGWNLVANPYGWDMELYGYDVDTIPIMQGIKNEQLANGYDDDWVAEQMKRRLVPAVEYRSWNEKTGQYDEVTSLKPYEAVWVKLVDSTRFDGYLSPYPLFMDTVQLDGSLKRARPLAKQLAKSGVSSLGWNMRLMLSDEKGKKDTRNTLGAGKFAWNFEEPPAGMGDRVNLSILDGGKRLEKCMKVETEGNAYEWNVELSATSSRRGYLEVAGADALLERGLRVFVTLDGETHELHAGERLPVDLAPTAKAATIRVAPAARKVVVRELRGLNAVQAGGSLQVTFDAAGMGGSRAQVDVFDMKGASVAKTALRAVDGRNTVSIAVPRRGLYMVRVSVAGQVALRRVLFK